jgi:hypothetical protein
MAQLRSAFAGCKTEVDNRPRFDFILDCGGGNQVEVPDLSELLAVVRGAKSNRRPGNSRRPS